MAKIVENEHGGRRMIRLSGDDIVMVMAMVQREFRNQAATPAQLQEKLTTRPFYLPEEAV